MYKDSTNFRDAHRREAHPIDYSCEPPYQAILAEGEVIGEIRGKIEGKVDLLLDLGSERYGDPDPTLLAAIRSIDDSGRIKQLIKHMSDFASWAELLGSS